MAYFGEVAADVGAFKRTSPSDGGDRPLNPRLVRKPPIHPTFLTKSIGTRWPHSPSRGRVFGQRDLAKYVALVFFLITAANLVCTPAFAQSDVATITGRVTDQTDSVIVGASIQMINADTGASTSTITNAEGIYVLSGIRPGSYRLEVKQKGFRSIVLSNLVLNVQDTLSRNFRMELSTTTTAVIVSSSVAEERNLSPAVSTVVDQEFVQNIPLNGRTFQSLLALTPGYQLAITGDTAGGEEPGQFSVNGQRANANYFMVDGMSANFAIYGLGQSVGGTIPAFTIEGGTNGLVSVDATQEFRVQTSNFAPEFGRTPGAQISIVTRSGGNQLHGSVFEYLRNDVFDARNYFDAPPLPKPPLRQNDFGGTLGGAIRKDRLFYFFSYEGLRLREPETATGDFYTVAARANVAPVFQPLLAALPIPNGPVNPDGITAPLTMAYSDPTSFDSYSLRVDYKVNRRTTLFGRYGHSPSVASEHLYSQLTIRSVNIDTLTIGTTVSFGPNKVNDFRANWSRSTDAMGSRMIRFYGAVPPPLSMVAPPGYSSSTYEFSLFPLGQSGGISTGESGSSQRQIEFADSFSMSEGTHLLKFGGDARQLTPSNGGSNGALVLSTYAQLQAGIAGSVNPFGTIPITARTYNFSFFAQDVWKATSNLTFTYGLRWEINTPLASITAGKPLYAVNGIFNSEPFGLAPAGVPLYHTHFNNLAPRFGVAYQATRETVVRGGFGVFYDIGFGGGISGTITNFPYSLASYGLGPVPFALTNPAFITSVPNNVYVSAVDPNLKLPLVYEWNVAVERALGSNQTLALTYLGSHGTRLIREDQIQINPSELPTIFATRNADWSNYNALQVQFQRRMSAGLQALASYTLAKSEDTNSSDVCQCTTSDSLQNINVARDYGPSEFDARNSFAAALSYELPSPQKEGISSRFLGGWSLYGIVHVNSALPFNIYARGSSPIFGEYFTRPDVVPGEPFYLPSTQPGGRILNAAAFAAPPAGEQGDLPRDYFRGFPINQTDLAVSRRFPISEGVSLLFRAEYFNVMNHPMFGPPGAIFNNTVGLPGFGEITSTFNNYYGGLPGLSELYEIGGPRSGQLMLKIQF